MDSQAFQLGKSFCSIFPTFGEPLVFFFLPAIGCLQQNWKHFDKVVLEPKYSDAPRDQFDQFDQIGQSDTWVTWPDDYFDQTDELGQIDRGDIDQMKINETDDQE